jgi:cytochrome P450
MPTELKLGRYDEISAALYHPELSRTLDKRSYDAGNPRAGTLSMLHGDEHKQRRRMENPLFNRQALIEYETKLFPRIVDDVLAGVPAGPVDLFRLSGALSTVLAAKRAGIDHDGSPEQLAELFGYVIVIAQAAAIYDVVGDRERVQAETIEVLRRLDERYVTPARERRQRLLDAGADGDAPNDLMTMALRRLRSGDGTFDDHQLLVREVALFVHGGSHTSAQTICNTFYYLFGMDGEPRPEWLRRAAESPLDAQKCVHETLRLRPTNPEPKRRVESDTDLLGHELAEGSRVLLDVRGANRDPELFGPEPDRFDPDRPVADDMPLWGLSFGVGPHICIGRSVAGGFPLTGQRLRSESVQNHLYGLVALMLQALAARRPRLDPGREPVLDERTSRGTRWLQFPVLLDD